MACRATEPELARLIYEETSFHFKPLLKVRFINRSRRARFENNTLRLLRVPAKPFCWAPFGQAIILKLVNEAVVVAGPFPGTSTS